MNPATTASPPSHAKGTSVVRNIRVESIDLLRGVVMIIMALDHVRDYFHSEAFLFSPTDLDRTSPALFFTRWITHFCAPVFVFLAGTSAYFVGLRKGAGEVSSFLLKRGLWLIVLEFTVINFSWFFNVRFSFLALTVIWALAIGMILLSLAVRLPFRAILATGIVLVGAHNLLDSVHVDGSGPGAVAWAVLHETRVFSFEDVFLFTGYPIIPWTGVMLLGYCFGRLYTKEFTQKRRLRILTRTGLIFIGSFVLLRALSVYGEPSSWKVYNDPVFTFLSFINVTKYPPSLLYILITLGPAFLFLAAVEDMKGRITGYITALGRVPMFYYIIHLYVIHILAVVAAMATGFEFSDMVFNTWVTDSPNLKGYGFGLGFVYFVWMAVVIVLFPLCLWYDRYKSSHREKWWLSYL